MIKAIAIDDEPMALKVIESHCSKVEGLELVKTFTAVNEAAKFIRKFPVDLIFLDIQMPEMSGLEFVKKMDQKIHVVFTTAYSEYAVQSYDLNAIDYLMKPIGFARFESSLNKVKDQMGVIHSTAFEKRNYVLIRADYSLVKVLFSEILYIEALSDYVKINLIGKKTLITRMSMRDILEKIPSAVFLRVHKSFIVSIDHIDSVRNQVIYMPGVSIPIGKTFLTDFYSHYKK